MALLSLSHANTTFKQISYMYKIKANLLFPSNRYSEFCIYRSRRP